MTTTAAASGAPDTGTFRSFRVHNFRVYFVGLLVSQTGSWLTRVGRMLLVLHLTDDGLAAGIVTACEFVPIIFLGAWTGLVVDRSDKRNLLIVVQIAAMANSAVMATLGFIGDPPVMAIYGVALVSGCVAAFDFPLRRSFIVELVQPSDLTNAVGLNSAVMTMARVFGPALAGLVVSTLGYGWCFALDALSYVAVLTGLAMIDRSALRSPAPPRRARGQIRDGLRYAGRLSLPIIWIPFVVVGVAGVLSFNFAVVIPLLVTRTFDRDLADYTWLFSVLAVGSVFGALGAARRQSVEMGGIVGWLIGLGIALLLLAASPNFALAFPAALLVGWTSSSFMTGVMSIVQIGLAPDMQGRISSLQYILVLGSSAVGGPAIGYACDRLGPRVGLIIGTAGAVAAAVWGWRAARVHLGTRPATTSSDLLVRPVAERDPGG